MAFKLTKDEIKRRDEIVGTLEERLEVLRACIDTANTAIEQAVAQVTAEVDAYNEAIGEAQSFAEEVASRLNDEYGDKSERWQEGEKGEIVRAWIDEWEGVGLTRAEPPEIEPIEPPNDCDPAELETLAEEAE